jgi:hypothetical protein
MAARDIVSEAFTPDPRSSDRSDRRRRHHQALMWREIRRLAAGRGDAAGRPARPAARLQARAPAGGTGSP